MINIIGHFARPPGAPGPHAWRHIVKNRQVWYLAANPTGHRMGEIRTVDDHQDIGLERDNVVYQTVGKSDDQWQPRQNGAEAHNRDLCQGKQTVQPRVTHQRAADTAELQFTLVAGAQARHKFGTQLIAGFLACDNCNPQGFHDCPAGG